MSHETHEDNLVGGVHYRYGERQQTRDVFIIFWVFLLYTVALWIAWGLELIATPRAVSAWIAGMFVAFVAGAILVVRAMRSDRDAERRADQMIAGHTPSTRGAEQVMCESYDQLSARVDTQRASDEEILRQAAKRQARKSEESNGKEQSSERPS